MVLDAPQVGNEVTSVQKASDSRKNLMEHWNRTQESLSRFWEFWQRDYLNTLRERYQRTHKGVHGQTRRKPQLGEVVLLGDPNLPRGLWKLGRIVRIFPSSDEEIRTVQIVTTGGRRIIRPVSLLYPLEVSDEEKAGDAEPAGPIKISDVNLEVSDSE